MVCPEVEAPVVSSSPLVTINHTSPSSTQWPPLVAAAGEAGPDLGSHNQHSFIFRYIHTLIDKG